MSVSTSVPDGSAPGPQPRGRRVPPVALPVLACAAQALVLLATFLMGLGWGGVTYVVALLQATMAFPLIAWLSTGKRRTVLLVPVLSAVLTAGLVGAGHAYGRTTACSDRAVALGQQLAPPPGTTVELEGDYLEGCVARTTMRLSNQQIVEHYQAELARLGWREVPGVHDSTIGVAAVKDGVHLVVEVNSLEEAEGQMFEVVVGEAAGTSPCSLGTVDGHLQRQPTTGLEPGDWTVLTSTDDGPASVVIRDSAAAVVLEQQAHPRPDDDDDMARVDAQSGFPILALDEGSYEIACRHGDGAVTTVALPVAWAGPDSRQLDKHVAVQVFRTPDHWK